MQQSVVGALTALFKSKLFWLIVAAVIIYIVVRRNWNTIASLGKPRFIEYETNADGEVLNFSAAKKEELKLLAQDLYAQIYTPFASNYKVFDAVRYLNDQELLWINNYYKQAFKSTMYSDIDDEILSGTDSDEIILGRLKKMGITK